MEQSITTAISRTTGESEMEASPGPLRSPAHKAPSLHRMASRRRPNSPKWPSGPQPPAGSSWPPRAASVGEPQLGRQQESKLALVERDRRGMLRVALDGAGPVLGWPLGGSSPLLSSILAGVTYQGHGFLGTHGLN